MDRQGILPDTQALVHQYWILTRRAAIIMRGYISGLMENWLFAPQSFDLKKEARDYVAILLEMYLLCPTLRNPATNE